MKLRERALGRLPNGPTAVFVGGPLDSDEYEVDVLPSEAYYREPETESDIIDAAALTPRRVFGSPFHRYAADPDQRFGPWVYTWTGVQEQVTVTEPFDELIRMAV